MRRKHHVGQKRNELGNRHSARIVEPCHHGGQDPRQVKFAQQLGLARRQRAVRHQEPVQNRRDDLLEPRRKRRVAALAEQHRELRAVPPGKLQKQHHMAREVGLPLLHQAPLEQLPEHAQKLVFDLLENVVDIPEVQVERSAVVARPVGDLLDGDLLDRPLKVQLPKRLLEVCLGLLRHLRLLVHDALLICHDAPHARCAAIARHLRRRCREDPQRALLPHYTRIRQQAVE